MSRIVKRRSLRTNCQTFMDVGISCGSARPSLLRIILPAFHKSLVPFKNSCFGHGRISIYITQHLQCLSRRFSKFDTKFNVNSLLNRHSAIELPTAKKLNQISRSNFLLQVINHIHLWLQKSKNNCDIVSKQLLNKEHMLRHTVKVLITDGLSCCAICDVSPVSFQAYLVYGHSNAFFEMGSPKNSQKSNIVSGNTISKLILRSPIICLPNFHIHTTVIENGYRTTIFDFE